MPDTFGERLKRLRKNAGFTQAEVAERLGKSASAVRMWELGANEPDIAMLLKLSAIFDSSLDYLLCRDCYLGDSGAVRTNLPVYRLSDYREGAEPETYRSISSEYLRGSDAFFFLLNDTPEMEGLIPLGAVVLIRKQDSCLDGQTVFLRAKGAYYLRRLHFFSGGVLLSGSLDGAPPLWFENDEPTLTVLGTAVEYRKAL